MRKLTSALVLSFVVSTSLVACGPSLPGKMALAGQSAMLQSGCQVSFQDAWARPHEVKVKLWVANMSQAFMMVNRDGFAMRLPDGRILRREGAVHNVYTLPPGGGHEVFVDFKDPIGDLRTFQGMSLIVGGIAFSSDPRERVVGEIPLVATGAHP